MPTEPAEYMRTKAMLILQSIDREVSEDTAIRLRRQAIELIGWAGQIDRHARLTSDQSTLVRPKKAWHLETGVSAI